ncbi:MAG: hypothetical protein KDK36_05380 [Leptospiraceae bacterium]|nr:hypothetical protein [Leptospiraceae bacterium]
MISLNIQEDNLNDLEVLKSAEPGTVQLSSIDISHEIIDSIIEVIKVNGLSLDSLTIKLKFPLKPYHYNLKDFDFAEYCPNLIKLDLKRCDINASILNHPNLIEIKLEELWLTSESSVRIGVDQKSILKNFQFYDSNWCDEDRNSIEELIIGPESSLQSFEYSIDEDYMECVAEVIEINSCKDLEKLYLRIDSSWDLEIKGVIPNLKKLTATSGRFGHHTINISDVEDGSSEYLIRLRDGNGPYKNEKHIFLGESKYFNTKKAKELIELLGGKIYDTLNESTTHVNLLGQLSEEWLSEKLSSKDLLELKNLIDNGQDIEVFEEEYISDYLDGWY